MHHSGGTDGDVQPGALARLGSSCSEESLSDLSRLAEYTNDYAMIPRSSSVLARRLPPTRPGHGNAQKYMMGQDESGQGGLRAGRGAAPDPRGGVGGSQTKNGYSKDMFTKRFDGQEDRPGGYSAPGMSSSSSQQVRFTSCLVTVFEYLSFSPLRNRSVHCRGSSRRPSSSSPLLPTRLVPLLAPFSSPLIGLGSAPRRCPERRGFRHGGHVRRYEHAVAGDSAADGKVRRFPPPSSFALCPTLDESDLSFSSATPIHRAPLGGHARPPPQHNNSGGGGGGGGGGAPGGGPRPAFRDTPMAHKPPPPGYICYRCGQKGPFVVFFLASVFLPSVRLFLAHSRLSLAGHWIQECPTNGDAAYDNRPRIKRTTGIPKSFLTEVSGPSIANPDEEDASVNKSGIMVTADGGFVVARPDKYVSSFAAIEIVVHSVRSREQRVFSRFSDLVLTLSSTS